MGYEPSLLQNYGLPGIVILALAGVVIFLYKQLVNSQKKNDALQETRLQETKETRDKLLEPIEQLIEVNKKNYDLLLIINNKRNN